jgi:hypothetical protein
MYITSSILLASSQPYNFALCLRFCDAYLIQAKIANGTVGFLQLLLGCGAVGYSVYVIAVTKDRPTAAGAGIIVAAASMVFTALLRFIIKIKVSLL